MTAAEISFNPRPRAGGDLTQASTKVAYCVSIHAPARGATWPDGTTDDLGLVSIHAPARGATSVRGN